jgi:hypothetical protein
VFWRWSPALFQQVLCAGVRALRTSFFFCRNSHSMDNPPHPGTSFFGHGKIRIVPLWIFIMFQIRSLPTAGLARRLRRGRILLEGFSGVTSVGSERVAAIRFRFGHSGVASVARSSGCWMDEHRSLPKNACNRVGEKKPSAALNVFQVDPMLIFSVL